MREPLDVLEPGLEGRGDHDDALGVMLGLGPLRDFARGAEGGLDRANRRHRGVHGAFDLSVLRRLGAKPFFLLPQFGCELGAEILGLEDLTNLERDVAVLDRPTLDPLERFLF